MEIEILRMVERIIIVLGGILSVVLGYKLFRIADLKTDSGANFTSTMFNMTFTKVGPGVFFALFGAYIMSTAIKTQIDIQTSQGIQTAINQGAILSQLSTTISKLPDSGEQVEIICLVRQIRGNTPTTTKRTLMD